MFDSTSRRWRWWEWSVAESRGCEASIELLHPDDRDAVAAAMHAILRGDADLYGIDYRIRSADGAYNWYSDRALVTERDSGGTPWRLRGITLSLGQRRGDGAAEDAVVAVVRDSFPEPGTEDPAMTCVQCDRLGYPPDRWIAMDVGIDAGFPPGARPTLCGECISRLYPQTADQMLSRLQISRQRVTRVASFSTTHLERELLDSFLRHEPSIELVASFDATNPPVNASWDREIDVAVVCTESEGKYLMDLVRTLTTESLSIPVLGYCLSHEHASADRTLHAGARGFVNATGSIGELVRAIHAVAAGGYHVSQPTAEWLRANERQPWREPHTRLSDREFQVFSLTVQRKSSAEIAQALNISPSTVAKHRQHVVAKLDLTSSYEIARYAKQHKLMD
ncbi:MAG: LuxR C-terminal-related transcriptional regulator [Spirochaetota bacterium]